MGGVEIRFVELIVTAFAAVFASSGFWLFLERFRNSRTLERELLIGLAHDRIVCLSMAYIERGWISQDEHENLVTFLYRPYTGMGGNGSAQRLMNEVNKLPITGRTYEVQKGEMKNVVQ